MAIQCLVGEEQNFVTDPMLHGKPMQYIMISFRYIERGKMQIFIDVAWYLIGFRDNWSVTSPCSGFLYCGLEKIRSSKYVRSTAPFDRRLIVNQVYNSINH